MDNIISPRISMGFSNIRSYNILTIIILGLIPAILLRIDFFSISKVFIKNDKNIGSMLFNIIIIKIIVFFLYPLLLNKKYFHFKLSELGFRMDFDKKWIVFSISLLFPLIISNYLVVEDRDMFLELLSKYFFSSEPLFWLFVAFTEEFFFRSFLINIGRKNSLLTLLLSSFIFTIAHFYIKESYFQLFAYGLIFGSLFILSKSIYPCIINHWIFNWLIAKPYSSNYAERLTSKAYTELIIVIISIVLLLVVMVYKFDNSSETVEKIKVKSIYIYLIIVLSLYFSYKVFEKKLLVVDNGSSSNYVLDIISYSGVYNKVIFLEEGKSYEVGFKNGVFEYIAIGNMENNFKLLDFKEEKNENTIEFKSVFSLSDGGLVEGGEYILRFKTRYRINDGQVYINIGQSVDENSDLY